MANWIILLLVLVGHSDAASLPPTMRAVVATAKANEGNFSLVEVVSNHAVPTPAHKEIIIAVHASSVNPVDWKLLSGDLPVRFPHILGFDVAGTVAAVGSGSTRLNVGDAVWADLGEIWPLRGGELGAYAEYALANEAQVGLKPQSMNFSDAATIPLVGLTTLQAYRKMGIDRRGANTTVVVTSGSGGTGFVGIQLAKAFGATKVITACGPTTQAFCKELGADTVVDYTQGVEALWQAAGVDDVDFVYDNFGAKGTADLAMPSLRVGGIFLWLPGKDGAASKHPKPGVQQINYGLCDATKYEDLDALASLVDAGSLEARVSRSYPLEQVVAAFNASYAGGVVGKFGISVMV